MIAQFNRFSIEMTMAQAQNATHSGVCDNDVKALLKDRKIQRQLNKIDPNLISLELKEYGAWDSKELLDTEANKGRIVWIAAGNIIDNR